MMLLRLWGLIGVGFIPSVEGPATLSLRRVLVVSPPARRGVEKLLYLPKP